MDKELGDAIDLSDFDFELVRQVSEGMRQALEVGSRAREIGGEDSSRYNYEKKDCNEGGYKNLAGSLGHLHVIHYFRVEINCLVETLIFRVSVNSWRI